MIILHKEFRYISDKKIDWSVPSAKEGDTELKDIIFIQNSEKEKFIDLICHALSVARIIVLLPDNITLDDFEKDYNSTLLDIPQESIDINKSNIVTEYFIIFTSGTTGKPKAVIHSIESISSKIKQRSRNFVWGLTYDPFRMAGLQVIFSAITNGDKLVISHNNNIKDTLDLFLKFDVNSISATPSYLKILLSYEACKKLPLNQITLGGEIADQTIITKIKSIFPSSKVTHIYASTEIGAAFSVQDGLSGFPSSFLNNKEICDGRMTVQEGELCFRQGDDVFRTGDMVSEENDRVYFKGRKDSQVNIGGNKIHLEQIENIIEEYENVKTANCIAIDHKFLNQIIIARVSLHDTENISLKEEKTNIRKLCIKKLPKFAIPAKIDLIESIELSNNSKKLR